MIINCSKGSINIGSYTKNCNEIVVLKKTTMIVLKPGTPPINDYFISNNYK